MTFRSLRLVIWLVPMLVITPLFAQKVSYDWDKDVDFSHYRTYKWAEVAGGQASDASTQKQIVGAINVQLQAKNLELTASDDADLYVTYQVVTEQNGQAASFNPDGEWRPGLGAGSKPQAGTMAKGTLLVNLYDHKMKKLIWRGTVAGASDNRQDVNFKVSKGLSKLFTYYPPPPSK